MTVWRAWTYSSSPKSDCSELRPRDTMSRPEQRAGPEDVCGPLERWERQQGPKQRAGGRPSKRDGSVCFLLCSNSIPFPPRRGLALGKPLTTRVIRASGSYSMT